MLITKQLKIIILIAGLLHGALMAAQQTFQQKGDATYYSDLFEGRKTASGEKFSQMGMTAAHRKLPFGTWVKVTNLKNHRSVIVRINDRGPFGKGRVIDLTKRAAFELGFLQHGTIPVMIEEVLYPGVENQLLQYAPSLHPRVRITIPEIKNH